MDVRRYTCCELRTEHALIGRWCESIRIGRHQCFVALTLIRFLSTRYEGDIRITRALNAILEPQDNGALVSADTGPHHMGHQITVHQHFDQDEWNEPWPPIIRWRQMGLPAIPYHSQCNPQYLERINVHSVNSQPIGLSYDMDQAIHWPPPAGLVRCAVAFIRLRKLPRTDVPTSLRIHQLPYLGNKAGCLARDLTFEINTQD